MIFEIILYNLFLLNYNDNLYILQTLQYFFRLLYIVSMLIILKSFYYKFLFLAVINFINLKFLWKKIFADSIVLNILTLHDHIITILNFFVSYTFRLIHIPNKVMNQIESWDAMYICYISDKEKQLLNLLKKEIMYYLISKNTPSKSQNISKDCTNSRRNREKLFMKVKKT